VHVAVWDFVRAIHDETLEELVQEPIYQYHFRQKLHIPAIAKYQIEELSGESERVITDTLATLVDEGVLSRYANNGCSPFNSEGEPIRWRGRKDHSHPKFSVLWVPTVLPQSLHIRQSWPQAKSSPPDPFTMMVDVAENNQQAIRVDEQLQSLGLTREEFDAMINSVREDGISLDEALAEAASD